MTLAVDPGALDGAGATIITTADCIGSALAQLTGALSGSASMCGNDPVGAAMGRSYDTTAQSLLQAMTTARNGLINIGDGVRISAHNYSRADASADVSGRGEPLPVPPSAGRISLGTLPSAVGAGPDAPAGWGWVAEYIGMIWPNGDPAKLRAAAAAWTTAGTALVTTESAVAGPMAVVGAQQIPEAEAIGAAFAESVRAANQVMSSVAALAGGLDRYATHIETTHGAIIDLLARICDPMTGIKEVWDFLTQDDEDEIARIAADIKTVVDNFEAETAALAGEMAPVIAQAADTVTEMGRWADKEWKHFLEDNAAGQELNGMGQAVKGIGEEGVDLVKDLWKYNPNRALVDPVGLGKDYGDLVKGMAPLVGAGGDGAPGIGETWKQVGKETLHWDLWKDNPAEALGRSLFDVATFFVPGGALTKLGKVGTGAAHVAEEAATNAPRALDTAAHAVDGVPAPAAMPHVDAPAVKPGDPAALPHPGENAGAGTSSTPAEAIPRPVDGSGTLSKGSELQSISASNAGVHSSPTEQRPTLAPGTTAAAAGPTHELAPSGVHTAGPVPENPDPLPHNDHSGHVPNDGAEHGSGAGPLESAPHQDSNEAPRIYSLMDGTEHVTSFAPEQLPDTHRVSEVLRMHGIDRSDLIDLINRSTHSLTPQERTLLIDVRDALPEPTRDTVMQKVIPPGYFDRDGTLVQSRADDYIMENNGRLAVDQVGGAVTTAGDEAHLSTPAQIHDGLRLDCAGSPFASHAAGTHIIRFQADSRSAGFYEVPRRSELGGVSGYDTWGEPFTGNGFTKASGDVIPEYIAKDITMREGAEMWEVLDNGTQRLVAVLKDRHWIPQGN